MAEWDSTVSSSHIIIFQFSEFDDFEEIQFG